MTTRYGQVIIGPPGSGKSTYCHGVQQLLSNSKSKDTLLVNLDPANDTLPYTCDIDIRDLITVEDIMEEYNLGPNGALVYCMSYLNEHLNWLLDLLMDKKETYVIFDLPGQVELYTHDNTMTDILTKMTKMMDIRVRC